METYIYEMADGSEQREEVPGSPFVGPLPIQWVQVGGPDNRGLATDGTLAWGLLAVEPEGSWIGSPIPDQRRACLPDPGPG